MGAHYHVKQYRRGFTIVELLIVVVVVAIIAGIVVVGFNTIGKQARDARRLTDIQSVAKALGLYYAENGSYPSTGGLTTDMPIADQNCTNNNPNKSADWVPGLAPQYIQALPQSFGPRETGYGCYIYASNGQQYVLSAWRALETGPQTEALYRRLGFREAVFSNDEAYHCNTSPALNSYWDGFYRYSYTVTNVTTCAETGF